MGYGIYRIEKRTKDAVGGIKKENNRTKEAKEEWEKSHPGEIYLPNSDIDWSKTKDNYYFKKDEEWHKTIKKEIDGLGLKKKPRKDAIVLLDHFVGISPEDAEEMDEKALKDFFEDAYDHIQKEYGHVLNAVVHVDETTPHMHVVTVPITKDGRLSAKDLTSTNKKKGLEMGFNQVQDRFYKEVSKKYGLKRGEPKSKTNRKHRTKAEYELEKLNKEIESAKKELKGVCKDIDFAQQQFEKSLLEQEELNRQNRKIKENIVNLQNKESELLLGNKRLEKEKQALEGQINDFKGILDKAKDMFGKAIDFFFKRDFDLADTWVDLTVEQTHKDSLTKLDEPLKSGADAIVETAASEIQTQFRKRKSR